MAHYSGLGTGYSVLGTLLALAAGPALAQQLPPPYQPISVFAGETAQPPAGRPAGDCDRPTELPPLLPVPPSGPTPPRPPGPRGPVGEYDPGYVYIPERAPETVRVAAEPCGPAGRGWITPSLELGWSQPGRLPPLVRLGLPTPGGLVPGPVVFGGERLPAPFRAGFGLAAGLWLDRQHSRGVDASFYFLGEGTNRTTIFSGLDALLLPTAIGALPLADPATGSVGSYEAGLSTRFATADVNYRRNLLCNDDVRLDALFGYRYGYLGEDLDVFGKRLGPVPRIVRFHDHAGATNHFHGGQLGLAGEYRLGRWYLGATGKVALGTVFTETGLDGKFRVDGGVLPFGFYSDPGVSGEREHHRFGVMPAAGVTLGRQLGEFGRVFVGYNFLYLTDVTRAGDVIDPTPDPAGSVLLAAAQGRPAGQRDVTTSDFWVQSVSLGVEWRY